MVSPFDARPWARIARAMLKGALHLRSGQNVVIETWAHTLQVAETIGDEARGMGIRPTLLYLSESAFLGAPVSVREPGAGAIGPAELAAAAASNGYILLPGPDNLDKLGRQGLVLTRLLGVRRELLTRTLQQRSIPGVFLIATLVLTDSTARWAGLNPSELRSESLASSLIQPRAIQRDAKPLAKRLRRGRHLTITHPNGTRLDLRLAARRPILDDGRVDAQDLASGRVWTTIPSGVLHTTVDERFAEGWFVANRPSRHMRGAIIGTKWLFSHGHLVHHSIQKGAKLFESAYERAGRERTRPAFVSIGLNPRIRNFPFAEDQERGVVTLYIGGNSDYRGRSAGAFREYALLRGATVEVDGEPLVKRGRLASA